MTCCALFKAKPGQRSQRPCRAQVQRPLPCLPRQFQPRLLLARYLRASWRRMRFGRPTAPASTAKPGRALRRQFPDSSLLTSVQSMRTTIGQKAAPSRLHRGALTSFQGQGRPNHRSRSPPSKLWQRPGPIGPCSPFTGAFRHSVSLSKRVHL